MHRTGAGRRAATGGLSTVGKHLIIRLLAGLGILLAPMTGLADAVDRWIDVARQGNVSMQFALGQAYASGSTELGVASDPDKALHWYRQAAGRGHAEAQYLLGQIYEKGQLTEEMNRNSARAWYQRAADAGHPGARLALARLDGRLPASRPATAPGRTPPPEHHTAVTTATPGPAAASLLAKPASLGDRIFAALEVPDNSYWVWWQGALALGLITIGFWYLVGVPLGVSSSYGTLVAWKDDEERAVAQASLDRASQSEILDAMMAETLAEFGEAALADMPDTSSLGMGGRSDTASSGSKLPTPWPVHLTFLAMTAVGGMLAAFLSGNFELRLDMGTQFGRLFGTGAGIWAVLFVAGLMIGFGVRLGGGCTSGHGLSGVSRLQPGSLLGTASFFGAAIAASYLLEILL